MNVDNISLRKLVFFIQSMEEMLFHYAHDSYKVPTLNFHYLCEEIIYSIKKIKSGVIDKGNLRPLLEELEYMLKNDIVARELYGDNISALFMGKDNRGEYCRKKIDITKASEDESLINKIESVLLFVLDDLKIDDKYYEKIKQDIELIIVGSDSFNKNEQARLFLLSRLLLTEVINRGYSQEYIYLQLVDKYNVTNFFTNDIEGELAYIWGMFTFVEAEYKVILPVKRKNDKKMFEQLKTVSVKDNANRYFGNSCRWVVELKLKAVEPVQAREIATSILCLVAAVKQYNRHTNKAYSTKKAIVIDLNSGREYKIKKPQKLRLRSRKQNEQQSFFHIGELILADLIVGEKLVNVINLHTSAIESTNVDNQLLNLWTIIEVLMEIERKNSYSKITQICNILTTVLNATYISSLLEQLVLDFEFHGVDKTIFLNESVRWTNELEKISALLVLPEYEVLRKELFYIDGSPLLSYRLEQYAEIFSSRNNIKEYLTAHRKRLEWQIMRIYRNRNMIVHDGSHLPYVDLILQNLHFYIDTLIDTIFQYVNRGYKSLSSIYSCLEHKEYQYLQLLDVKENESEFVNCDNYVKVILGTSNYNNCEE